MNIRLGVSPFPDIFTYRYDPSIKVDLVTNKQQIMQFLPLKQMGPEVDILFESPESQRVILEAVMKKLMIKGIQRPDENEVCSVSFDVIWSAYLRAHMSWQTNSRV